MAERVGFVHLRGCAATAGSHRDSDLRRSSRCIERERGRTESVELIGRIFATLISAPGNNVGDEQSNVDYAVSAGE